MLSHLGDASDQSAKIRSDWDLPVSVADMAVAVTLSDRLIGKRVAV
jgi:hypothetical protein